MGYSHHYHAEILEALETAREGSTKRRCECPACPELAGSPDRHRRSLVVKPNGWCDCYRCGFTTRLPGYEGDDEYIPPEPDDVPLEDRIPEGFDLLYGPRAALRLRRPRKYLETTRGLDPAVLEEAGVGACTDGFYENRIVVPILSEDGADWLGFSARSWVVGTIPLYRYPPWMRRSEVLYNSRILSISSDTPVFVVEGVFDALYLWPDAVASLGDISKQQFDMLAASRRPVVFVPDGDAWRKGEAHAMALGLRGVRAGALKLSPGCDPDELDRGDIYEAARVVLSL